MKLIRELNEDIQTLVETANGVKTRYITGIFLQGDIKNRNGRIYPMGILESAVNRYIDTMVKGKRAYGELGHPDGPTINLERVSHRIVSLEKEGRNYIGKAQVMDTPYGNIVEKLLAGGGCLGVSSRGVGTLKETDNAHVVGSDLMFATAADVVADPSAPEAFVNGIMENQEWLYVSGKWVSRFVEESQKTIRKTSSKKMLDTQIEIFESFMTQLKNGPFSNK
jgi:hypothetical protein